MPKRTYQTRFIERFPDPPLFSAPLTYIASTKRKRTRETAKYRKRLITTALSLSSQACICPDSLMSADYPQSNTNPTSSSPQYPRASLQHSCLSHYAARDSSARRASLTRRGLLYVAVSYTSRRSSDSIPRNYNNRDFEDYERLDRRVAHLRFFPIPSIKNYPQSINFIIILVQELISSHCASVRVFAYHLALHLRLLRSPINRRLSLVRDSHRP